LYDLAEFVDMLKFHFSSKNYIILRVIAHKHHLPCYSKLHLMRLDWRLTKTVKLRVLAKSPKSLSLPELQLSPEVQSFPCGKLPDVF